MAHNIAAKHWQLDHFGHAVNDLDSAIEKYHNLFGFKLEFRESLPEHQVEAAFLGLANCTIELLMPTAENTPLGRFIKKRGEGFHHLCYRVDSLREELERLDNAGVRLIDRAPRAGSRGTEIAFIHPESCLGILTELSARQISPKTTQQHG